jgi:hypothetical protein
MKSLFVALLLAGSLTLPAFVFGSAEADETRDPRAIQIAEDPDFDDIIFSEIERRLIRSYYDRHYDDWYNGGGNKNKSIPPGIAKKGGWLPPGIAKQLARGNYLPRDVVFYPLPYDLRNQLPYRSGYDYYVVDDRVMLVQIATNLILDVLTVAAIEAID